MKVERDRDVRVGGGRRELGCEKVEGRKVYGKVWSEDDGDLGFGLG